VETRIDSDSLRSGETLLAEMGPPVLIETRDASASRTRDESNGKPSLANVRQMLAGLHVLFVDDQEDVRRLVALILRRFGASVETAESAESAKCALERRLPDVLVSDIQMPHASGIDLIRDVRNGWQQAGIDVPAAALSAFGRDEDRARAIGAGFREYMTKPVEPVVLARTVARLAGR
jgi:CheY-like chemotaxis protein